MAPDYVKMTVEALSVLPAKKREEVYDFAEFLRASTDVTMVKKKRKKGSVLNLINLGKSGRTDIALNHDAYLYD